jgi:Ser-tRNA(Ala) deacylase AlaX
VRFIGINTCVPEIESETHSSLINFNSQEQVDDTSKKILEKMSFIMNKKGQLINKMISFEEDQNIFELETLSSWNRTSKEDTQVEQLRKALILGIKD